MTCKILGTLLQDCDFFRHPLTLDNEWIDGPKPWGNTRLVIRGTMPYGWKRTDKGGCKYRSFIFVSKGHLCRGWMQVSSEQALPIIIDVLRNCLIRG